MNESIERVGPADDPTALPARMRALVEDLADDGERLQERVDPRGTVAARVGATLDAWERARAVPGDAPAEVAPLEVAPAADVSRRARALRLREWVALAAAALLVVLALPRSPRADGGASVSSLLAASEIERLHPIHLLRALPGPLNALVEAEASAVESDVRRAAQGLVSELPGLFGLRPVLDRQ